MLAIATSATGCANVTGLFTPTVKWGLMWSARS
jgi:hypothetical protein